MTALAKSRLKEYHRKQEEAHQRFFRKLKVLTPKQKKDVLVRAGVLTKKGKFTAHYR